ncbi:MAG: histidine phosphatase family protein [Pseudomonadota bacterium]
MIRFLTALALSLVLTIALALKIPASASAERADPDLRRLLQHPGVHAIMRHALAPGTGDPAGFQVRDCRTQRNLDDRGRTQAMATGEKMRSLGADFDAVRTSQWCRCKDTADLLALGPVVEDAVLNSFFEDRSTATAQTDALRAFLADLPPDRRVMLVTHQVNITALTGRAISSGEVFLIRHTESRVEVLGRLLVAP